MSALELKIPPVAVTLLFAGLMWALARTTPSFYPSYDLGFDPNFNLASDLPGGLRLAALTVFTVAAAAIGLSAVGSFRRARTTVNPLSPQGCTTLVTSGVFRYSRNPMYLALLLALLGWGLYLASPVAVLLALAFIPWMNRFQIRPEERVLLRVFGQAFADYCQQVRRWL
ncbi:MAG: methyltransferase family protein [Lysobacterales bacterium]